MPENMQADDVQSRKAFFVRCCLNNADEESCIKKLKKFAKNHQIMPAYIGSIGMFTDTKTIFVSPIMNSNMFSFQRELFEY